MSAPRATRRCGALGVCGVLVTVIGCRGQIDDASTDSDGLRARAKAAAERAPSGLVDPLDAPASADACAGPTPSRPLLRRLSRGEYDASVEDLLGIASRAGAGFVADTAVEGFDNHADALRVTPLLADQLAAAADAHLAALGDGVEALLPCALAAGDAACAAQFVAQFGRRAYRRPLSEAELERYRVLYEVGAADAGFRGGVELVLGTFLQAPGFLYRSELGRDAGDGTRALDPHEIASELSYLVTGSTPDAELRAAADADALGTSDARTAQVQRLLQSPRGQAQRVRFVRQWLELDRLGSVPKDAALFAELTSEVRAALAEEVAQFVGHVVRDGDGTLGELLSAPLTFADATLAAFYGLPAPDAAGFQRYDAPDPARHGLLTLGAVAATHARPDGTSPVHRGKLVRERVLCQKLQPPPPGLSVQPPAVDPGLSTRERYRAHSAEQPCQGCHRLIDPVGFAFEHLDGVGRYRADEAGHPIDASGQIVDSRATDGQFDGTGELSALLADSPEVADCLVLQWFRFGYALDADTDTRCLLQSLQDQFRDSGGRLEALVEALANSPQITTRVGAAGAGDASDATSTHTDPRMDASSTPTPAAPAPSDLADAARFTVNTDSSWPGGHCDSVTVFNDSAAAVDWALTLSLDGTLTDHWNSVPDADSGEVTFRGAEHNARLAAGASTSFGYCLAN